MIADTSGLFAIVFREPVDEEQVDLAIEGFRTYGRGRHPAQLNFGDLFAYALARQKQEPLLFVGQDFSQTALEKA